MNYRHIYHAGNFADVFKHLALCFVLEKLVEKDAPFFVLDTHSGIGKYDLSSLEANKTGEYKKGILRLYNQVNLDPIFSRYLNLIKKLNRLYGKELRIYPGSGSIIKYFLRTQDRAILSELNNQDFIFLKRCFAGNRQVRTLCSDGYELIKSQLPPKEKRGLIFIDPPFEKGNGKESDFNQILRYLLIAHKKFSTGIYLIWYPIINQKASNFFLSQIKATIKSERILVGEIFLDKEIKDEFKGCGVLIINYPWLLNEKLNTVLSVMTKVFISNGDKNTSSRVFQL